MTSPLTQPQGERSGNAAGGRIAPDMPALTALRAVAALLVFLYHFPPKGLGYLVDVVVSQGHVGVTVFFVLSGFLITVRYYPQFERGERRLADYFVRRAARILPLYYVVLALTHLLSTGAVPVDVAHWPEWTLTQGLFDPSLEAATIPTAWSLTVEECFYASTPLLFLGMARLRRWLGAAAGTVVALAAAVAGVHLAGSLIAHWTSSVGAADLPFLSDERLLRYYTIFGRFPDFAIGVAAAQSYLSGAVAAAWRRPGGGLVATLLAAAGAALLVASQAGMVHAVDDPAAQWRWNVLAAAASGGLVLALTCPQAPLTRLLSFRPAGYLGRISYALYLIQLTPLGNGLLYRVLPGHDGVHLLSLYIGMSAVAALLYHLVEEPARETLLGLWRTRSLRGLVVARTRPARGLSLAILFGALAAQHAAWVLGSLADVDEARIAQLLGNKSPDVIRATVTVPALDGREPRLRLPSEWRLGPSGDRRAPRSLLVFVDGEPVPFLGARPPDGPGTVAYYRRPRAEFLSFQIEDDAVVTVVNRTPFVVLAFAWSRLWQAPVALLALPLLLAIATLVLYRTRRASLWSPRVSLAFGAALLAAWLVSGVHLQPWAPLVLIVETASLAGLVAFGPTASPRGRPIATAR